MSEAVKPVQPLTDQVIDFSAHWAPLVTTADIRAGRKPRAEFVNELTSLMQAYGKEVLAKGTMSLLDPE